MDNNVWKELWLKNYALETPESKELDGMMKKTYKNFSYIPWATMVRLMMMQDPSARAEVILNEDGTPLFTTRHHIQSQSSAGETMATVMVHFVKVVCTFLDKEFVEIYPVQDKSYEANKVVDQNEINKAVQRAKAKIIATATGLAFKLYEDGDLQFEDADPKKPEKEKPVTKVEKKTEAPVKPIPIIKAMDTPTADAPVIPTATPVAPSVTPSITVVTVPDVKPSVTIETVPEATFGLSNEHMELATFLFNADDKIIPALQKLNTSLIKNFSISINRTDTFDEIKSKIGVIPSPKTTLTALKAMIK